MVEGKKTQTVLLSGKGTSVLKYMCSAQESINLKKVFPNVERVYSTY